ncbi:malto-oligosyltrehalose trehalohydrolase [Antarcticibacterium arcticum]|uniref:Malto-oligosyltrehalose trehalohydrolase n=1 Tax=Antarcticibacterium arcticum TaxID=2585771 RepID=A0A5B8YJ42_9FLAO|nr:malto-oligosyltrehalose trehalohydrolase [Antarcticibacterium arcticum]QED37088.1 malto-oligosyltrehalose trehalohydrolase [Antarcticibacterium arcticum]
MRKKVGAQYIGNNGTKFVIWAPFTKQVKVVLSDGRTEQLLKVAHGYWEQELSDIPPGTLYKLSLDDEMVFPDPASRSQAFGVHDWSKVTDPNSYKWSDTAWKGIPLEEMIIYELHVGTFTPEGTFEGVISKLDHLLELGINTIEILPVTQFPGSRNWGYDGAYPYAVQESYGGAEGLKKMIDTCHQHGIAVLLDAVYNHLGPEGNYLSQFGPYFTEKYKTPWGSAINFDDKYSDEVRNFFLESALMWQEEFHFDGLRLDAIHEIIDRGARHFLKELSQNVDELEKQTGRRFILIAESDLNDTKIINPYEKGGFGLEGQWVDDFHHSIHSILTGELEGYYKDYGAMAHLAKAFKQAFVYDGVYSKFRKRTVGNNPVELPPSKFVISIQNHDQVGNRLLGDRLAQMISLEQLKLAAGVMLVSPYIPMLFMGEEFAEDRPFQYFVSHGDPDLVKAVREGRKREFEYFYDKGDGEFWDPQEEETFNASKINWDFKEDQNKTALFNFYKKLINLKKTGAFKAFSNKEKQIEFSEEGKYIKIIGKEGQNLFAVFNFKGEMLETEISGGNYDWKTVIFSAGKEWGGSANFPPTFNSGEVLKIPAHSMLVLSRNLY